MVHNKQNRSDKGFIVISDHSIRTTQPSTMGGPLGNLGFWTLDSTTHLIMECQRGQNSIIIELHNSFMELHNSSIILNYGGPLIMDVHE